MDFFVIAPNADRSMTPTAAIWHHWEHRIELAGGTYQIRAVAAGLRGRPLDSV